MQLFAITFYFAIGVYLLPVLLFIGLVLAVWQVYRTLVPPRRSLRPCCAACQYDLSAACALVCPECGTDLRAAGITSRLAAYRLASKPAKTIFAWMFLVTVAALLVHTSQASRSVLQTSRYIPIGVPLNNALVELDVWWLNWHRTVIIVRRKDAAASAQLEVDCQTREFVLLDDQGNITRRGTAGTDYAVPEFFAAIEKSESAAHRSAAADQLAALLHRIFEGGADGNYFEVAPSIVDLGTVDYSGPPSSVLLRFGFFESYQWVVVAGVILGVAGAVVLVRRRVAVIQRLRREQFATP